MHLTTAERLIVMNQYAILKQLDPARAANADKAIQILANGLEEEYENAFESMTGHQFRLHPLVELPPGAVLDTD